MNTEEIKVEEKKSGRKLWKPVDSYVLVDLETTGLSKETNEIIEIGAIRVIDNEIVEEFNRLIKVSDPLDPFITQLTGITDEMLEQGETLETVLTDFNDFIDGQVLIGHNIRFDLGFLEEGYKKVFGYPLPNDYIDTLHYARHQIKGLPNYKLQTLANHFGISYEGAHRGLIDVIITYDVYNQLRQIENDK